MRFPFSVYISCNFPSTPAPMEEVLYDAFDDKCFSDRELLRTLHFQNRHGMQHLQNLNAVSNLLRRYSKKASSTNCLAKSRPWFRSRSFLRGSFPNL